MKFFRTIFWSVIIIVASVFLLSGETFAISGSTSNSDIGYFTDGGNVTPYNAKSFSIANPRRFSGVAAYLPSINAGSGNKISGFVDFMFKFHRSGTNPSIYHPLEYTDGSLCGVSYLTPAMSYSLTEGNFYPCSIPGNNFWVEGSGAGIIRRNVNYQVSWSSTDNNYYYFRLRVNFDILFDNPVSSGKRLVLYFGSPRSRATVPIMDFDNNSSINLKFHEVYYDYSFSTITTADDEIINQQKITNEKLDSVNDNITNSDSSGAAGDAGSFFSGFQTNTHGLTGIITAPLNLIQSITNQSCSPVSIPLPFVNKNLELPCMSTIYQQTFGGFLTLYQTITTGVISYWVVVRIFALVKDFKNPEHDEIEVMEL
jgi:hypothetical protein